MRVLLSAYACEPDRGSEQEIGWQRALHMLALADEVWVLTRANNQDVIEASPLSHAPGLHFIYYDLPRWALRLKTNAWFQPIYFFLWQWGAYRMAARIHQVNRFDSVYHATFSGMYAGSFMGRLGIPFILGPIAGGERAPFPLRRSMPLFCQVQELLRDLEIIFVRYSPLTRAALAAAERIYVTTPESLRLVLPKWRSKTEVQLSVAFNRQSVKQTKQRLPTSPRFVFVGRLLHWKGVHFAIRALAEARKSIPGATLTLIGSGPDERWLRKVAQKFGVVQAVDFVGQISRQKLIDSLHSYTAFIFPSLHDSGGMAVFEALSEGLPVICLDLGGPGVIVNESCGIVVPTKGADEAHIVTGLAISMVSLGVMSAAESERLAMGAIARASELSWASLTAHVATHRINNMREHSADKIESAAQDKDCVAVHKIFSKILLSAYACEPGKGSEPGVGWHWAIELARLGHQVEVITRSNNRTVIEKALVDAPIAGLHFHYYDLPPWGKWWKQGNRGIQLYYLLWQYGAYRLASRITHNERFDLVHHLTFGGLRKPSLMGRLGLPFVVGPIGGGEVTPVLLRGSFPLRLAFMENIRELSNKLDYLNPLTGAMFRQAMVIYCKTKDTLAIMPAECVEKCQLRLEIGLEPQNIKQEIMSPAASSDFVYAGRLIYMKGMHLALKAFFQLRRDLPNATFTIIGTGPEEGRLKRLTAALGLHDSVQWLGWLPQEEMWAQLCYYTAFVFPSLHDSSGNVVLEALSQALPVICLDTGGPGAFLPPSCSIKVPVENRCESEVIGDLKAAMRNLADKPDLRAQMALQALVVARANTWKDVVSRTYSHIEDVLHASRKCGVDRPV
jgi:glycosyltransferase involved in cell wall biosynthesis